MTAYKNGQYLVFDFENGKTVKYDLANNCMIGKKGKPVKGLRSQLAGYTASQIINMFPDENYKHFLRFVHRRTGSHTAGIFLDKIRIYTRLEQFFSAGILDVDIFCKSDISDVPKGLLQLIRKYELKLTDNVIDQYKLHGDIIRNILETDYISITKQDIYNSLLNSSAFGGAQHFHRLLATHKYQYASLMQYLDNLMTHEGMDRFSDTLRELYDYANMMSQLSPKFEKYPRYFLTSHRIAARNFNRLKQVFSEEQFATIRDERMEYSTDRYRFIYPKSTQCIKDEAVQQQNCLASYIQKVIDGKCHIIFMRDKDDPDNSLITLEVQDSRVVQSKGKFNRDPYRREQDAISKYNERLLKIREAA